MNLLWRVLRLTSTAKTYLSLDYFAPFWIILKYDWFNKELGAALGKNVASYLANL